MQVDDETPDPAITAAMARWIADHAADLGFAAGEPTVQAERLAGGGYANEVLHLVVSPGDRSRSTGRHLVLRRSPGGPTLFPPHDLDLEVAAQTAAGDHGVPVPRPVLHEPDPTVLGTPFLVMPLVRGRCVGDAPAFDDWVMGSSSAAQSRLAERFLATLARIHTTPWRDRDLARRAGIAPDGHATLDAELDRWDVLVGWAFDGDPPAVVTDAFAWCRAHRPATEPEPSLLWGDVRYGNTIVDDDGEVLAVLDWEMTGIGPAEHDLAWFTALEDLTAHFAGFRVPGFPTRDQVVAAHEARLGRPVDSFAWYEAFALCRSMVLNLRRSSLHARARGRAPRPAEDDAVVQRVWEVLRATDVR